MSKQQKKKKNEAKLCKHGKNTKGKIKPIWKNSEGCRLTRAKVPEGEKSKYCYTHGCQSCYFQNPKTTATSFRKECCGECKPKLEERKNRSDSWRQSQNSERNAKINEFQTKGSTINYRYKKYFSGLLRMGSKKSLRKNSGTNSKKY